MKKVLFLIIISIIILNCGNGNVKQIPYNEINRNIQITGALGFPLGTILTIEGTAIIDESSKENVGKVLLKIDLVNGNKLEKPVIMSWSNPAFVNVNKPVTGKKFKFIGYETGKMAGIPSQAFKYIPVASSKDLHFEVVFIIIKMGIN